MITRLEIDGFKTFKEFQLNLSPLSAVVGPNASGKSNLFDAIKFISLLSETDVRTALQGLRGEPEEIFRNTIEQNSKKMRFAIEVLLPANGIDDFGLEYVLNTQRLRYEIDVSIREEEDFQGEGIFITHEFCRDIPKSTDRAKYLGKLDLERGRRKVPFLETLLGQNKEPKYFSIRQDGIAESGTSKRGSPLRLSASGASRSALSTVPSAEFRHLFALKHFLSGMRFLEINPQAARRPNDRFEDKEMRQDASNLAAVLSDIQRKSSTKNRPQGAISDISRDLSSLITTVRQVIVKNDSNLKEYSFEVEMSDGQKFSSRVISDGTLRLLALLTLVNDPNRGGVLCFEEPENGVHEGRIPALIELLRDSTRIDDGDETYFQIILNTHSPAVMMALENDEIIAADSVAEVDPQSSVRESRTRMRTGVQDDKLFDFETDLTRSEIERLLKRLSGDA